MTNYERIQKASPDNLIGILNKGGYNPCKNCACQCATNPIDSLKIYLRSSGECNTTRALFSVDECKRKLGELLDAFVKVAATKNAKVKETDKDTLLTICALDMALKHIGR